MGGSTRNDEGYLVAGDGLRALAALMVLVFHGYVVVVVLLAPRVRGTDWGALGDVAARLSCGLYVFFVLSGYLVGGPWVRAWLRGGGFPRPWSYLGRRARRIVPAFWVVLAALVLVFGDFGAPPRDVLAAFAFGQVWVEGAAGDLMPQAWTLDVETMFYLAPPVLGAVLVGARGVPRSGRTRLVALLAALGAIFVVGLLTRTGPPAGTEAAGGRNLLTLGWAFVPGLGLAALEAPVRTRVAGRLAGRFAAWGLGLLGVAAVAALALGNLDDGQLGTFVAYAACGGGLVGGALMWQWTTGRAPRGLDTRLAHGLGRWSYGIYLVHVGVGRELARHTPAGLGPWGALAFVLAGMLVGSVVLAATLWWLVEEPALTGRLPRLRPGRPPAGLVETPTGPPVPATPTRPVPAGAGE